MKAIIGLGNPGPKFEATKHNVGFFAIDRLSSLFHAAVIQSKFQSLVGDVRVNGESVLLVKPMTFMNLSGQAVREVVQFYKLLPEEDIIVIYDDMDFMPGQMKLRRQGSAGGHNGIKSIIACLGTEEFCRVRIGIGRPTTGAETIAHVLGRFSAADQARVDKAVDDAVEAVQYSVEHDFERAMSRYNK